MKIAIAYWQGRVSPVFDVADRLFLIGIEDGREIRREGLRLASRDPFERAQELAERGVDVLLCGAVSSALEKTLTTAGIQVVGFLGGELEGIVAAYLEGQLNDGRVPPASRRGRRPLSGERLGVDKKQKPPVHARRIRT